MKTKVCTKCGKRKLLDEFHRNKTRKDNCQEHCKACRKGRYSEAGKATIYRYQQKESYQVYRKNYQQTKEYKTSKKKYNQSEKGKAHSKIWSRRYRQSEKGKAAALRGTKKQMEKFPLKFKARQAVNRAVRDNRLPSIHTRKCKKCHGQAEQYHHYKGYQKEHWLDVIPLCQKCHIALHTDYQYFQSSNSTTSPMRN